ncbi:carbon-nitrogen hydrolase family protein [Brevibacterium sediminis]
MTQLRVTVGQFEAQRDVNLNFTEVESIVTSSAASSDLVVLPENCMYSDPKKEATEIRYAEALDGDFITRLKRLAAENDTHILAGITETNVDDPSRPFNTLVQITPEGGLAGVYRKVHLYDAFGYRESDKVTPAPIADPLVFTINGITVGALTCYDLRFPEIVRWVALRGVDMIALPAAWASGPLKEFHWEALIRARAIENTIYFAGAGQTAPSCTGQSQIVDPMGVTLASAGEGSGAVATALVTSERVEAVRRTNPSLSNRRFDVTPAKSPIMSR